MYCRETLADAESFLKRRQTQVIIGGSKAQALLDLLGNLHLLAPERDGLAVHFCNNHIVRLERAAQDFIGKRVFDQPLNGTPQRTRSHRLVVAFACQILLDLLQNQHFRHIVKRIEVDKKIHAVQNPLMVAKIRLPRGETPRRTSQLEFIPSPMWCPRRRTLGGTSQSEAIHCIVKPVSMDFGQHEKISKNF